MRFPVRVFSRFALSILATAFIPALALTASAQDSVKKKVISVNDVPRFTYPVSSPPSAMLMADDATFNAFAQIVAHDIDSVLRNFDIDDKATLRALYAAKLNVQMLTCDNEAALSTAKTVKELQASPEARASSGILDRPLIEARIASHASAGNAFDQAFRTRLQESLNAQDWRLVQDRVKSIRRSLEVATPDLLVESEKQGLDPAAAKSNTVDLAGAETMIEDRVYLRIVYPVKAQALPVLSAYVEANDARKPAM
jgi:hypothetical protein